MDAQLGFHLDAPLRPALPFAQLGEEEQAVARALQWGRDNARRISEIAADAGLGSRRAQEIMQRLVHDHGWPIGTAMSEPHGAYLIDSPEELQATVELLRSRGISNLARAAALQRTPFSRYLAAVHQDIQSGEMPS